MCFLRIWRSVRKSIFFELTLLRNFINVFLYKNYKIRILKNCFLLTSLNSAICFCENMEKTLEPALDAFLDPLLDGFLAGSGSGAGAASAGASAGASSFLLFFFFFFSSA